MVGAAPLSRLVVCRIALLLGVGFLLCRRRFGCNRFASSLPTSTVQVFSRQPWCAQASPGRPWISASPARRLGGARTRALILALRSEQAAEEPARASSRGHLHRRARPGGRLRFGRGKAHGAHEGVGGRRLSRRVDVRWDRADGGANGRAGTAMGFHRGQEGRVHAAVHAHSDRCGGRAAVHQFRGLNVVAPLLVPDCGDDVVRHLVGGTPVGRAELARRFSVEHVALLAHVDLGLVPGDLEMVIALFEHLPERHVRRVAVLRHIERRHLERIGLDLERLLAAEERFARQRIYLRDLLVRHGVAACRRAVAMDHEKGAGASVGAIVGVRKSGIDRQIVIGIRIHQAGSDRIEPLRRLAVPLLDLGTQVTRPAADRIGLEQREAPVLVFLPDLELGFLLENPHEDRQFLRHVLFFDVGDHPVGKRLHVAAADGRRAFRVATSQRDRRCNRSGRQKRAHQRATIQPKTPQPLGFPKPSLLNRYPEPKPAARQAGSPTERPDVDLGVIR